MNRIFTQPDKIAFAMLKIKNLIQLNLLSCLLIGCANEISRIDSSVIDKMIKFPIDNITTKKEVLDRLGDPSKTFERDNILIYRVCNDNGKISLPNPKKRIPLPCEFDLVLVFTPNDILDRHSLVKDFR